MSKAVLPKAGRGYRIWDVVEDLCVSRTSDLADASMRGSYYLVREWLDELRQAGDVTDAEYDYFADEYEYYRDDVWPRIERDHGLTRPDTKPPTTIIEDGEEYTEAHLADAWDRTRGFIYLEKAGMAGQLELLTRHGWLVVAAQGESTRTFREYLAADDTARPVLTLTDADFYGEGIVDTLEGDSVRTKHLDLSSKLAGRVTDLGLTTADAEALDLPKERDQTQSPNDWRTELNALMSLRAREDVSRPLLTYAVAKMRDLDVPLCPLPVDDQRAEASVRYRIKRGVEDALSHAVDDVVNEVMSHTDALDLPGGDEGDGPRMALRSRSAASAGSTVVLSAVRDELVTIADDRRDSLTWRRQSAYEAAVVRRAGRDDVEAFRAAIEGAMS